MKKLIIILTALIAINPLIAANHKILGGTLATVGVLSAAATAVSAGIFTVSCSSNYPDKTGMGGGLIALMSGMGTIAGMGITYPFMICASELLQTPQSRLYKIAGLVASPFIAGLTLLEIATLYDRFKNQEK